MSYLLNKKSPRINKITCNVFAFVLKWKELKLFKNYSKVIPNETRSKDSKFQSILDKFNFK